VSKERELLEAALDHLHGMNSYEDCLLKNRIRAYLAEQKQYDALADRYVEGVTGGLEKCREYMDAQVWVAKELLKTPEPTQDEEPVAIVRFDDNDLAEIEWWDYARVTEGRHYLYFVPIPLTDEEIENEVRRMAGIYLDTMCEAIDRTTDKELADLHPAPRPEFVRLSEEEVNSLTYAPYEPYELICAVENRLVEKNK